MARADGRPGRQRRHGQRNRGRTRRRRIWATVVGAVIGWGLAGLDGGFAGTADIPAPRADFVATGIVVSSGLGTVPFDLERSGRLVRQVVEVADDRVEMLFDRLGDHVIVVNPDRIAVIPTVGATASLLDPFSRAERFADAPLQIVHDGIGTHLDIPCRRFRATGTAKGQPLHATACVTATGVPLLTALSSGSLEIRTQIDRIEFAPPDLDIFAVPTEAADLTDG